MALFSQPRQRLSWRDVRSRLKTIFFRNLMTFYGDCLCKTGTVSYAFYSHDCRPLGGIQPVFSAKAPSGRCRGAAGPLPGRCQARLDDVVIRQGTKVLWCAVAQKNLAVQRPRGGQRPDPRHMLGVQRVSAPPLTSANAPPPTPARCVRQGESSGLQTLCRSFWAHWLWAQ